jgi:3-deoxy-D-manno-octulosonate 8-phosphate phosphatase (KDO 8-P phosphatase)
MLEASAIERRAARIKLLLMDCDGVLTDGRIWLLANGDEEKGFHVHDGLGLDLWHRAGLRSGIISGRTSSVVAQRAKDLKIEFVSQGAENKVEVFLALLKEAGVDDSDVAYIGDDLNDIPVLLRAELAVAVADASEETRAAAHLITRAKGGHGAVREVIELILKSQGRWANVKDKYLKSGAASGRQ